jgi:hypothetical protein
MMRLEADVDFDDFLSSPGKLEDAVNEFFFLIAKIYDHNIIRMSVLNVIL